MEEASLRGEKIGGEHRAVRGLAIRRERERGVGGNGKTEAFERFAQECFGNVLRGNVPNGSDVFAERIFPRAVVQRDVQKIAGGVVHVERGVVVVVNVRKFDAVRGGEFCGEAVGIRVAERLCLIDPGGLAVLVERKVDRPADAAQVRRREGGVAQVAVGLRGVGDKNSG